MWIYIQQSNGIFWHIYIYRDTNIHVGNGLKWKIFVHIWSIEVIVKWGGLWHLSLLQCLQLFDPSVKVRNGCVGVWMEPDDPRWQLHPVLSRQNFGCLGSSCSRCGFGWRPKAAAKAAAIGLWHEVTRASSSLLSVGQVIFKICQRVGGICFAQCLQQ